MCGGKGRGCLDAMQEKNLVAWGDDHDTGHVSTGQVWCGGGRNYLALGRGIATGFFGVDVEVITWACMGV